MRRDHRYNEMFTGKNDGDGFYSQYREKIIYCVKKGYYTLPIAAAYNAGFEEGYAKARNELCHISQTKND